MATSDYNASDSTASGYDAPFSLEVQVPPRLLTAADLAVLPTELPSGNVDYELDNGRVMMMSPAGGRHGLYQLRMGAALHTQGAQLGHGLAWTEGALLLSRNPDSVFVPDVSFVAQDRLPLRESAEGYIETIPDLVIEIRSKNDSMPHLERKISRYLQAGVKQAWIVDPASRTVLAHRPRAEVQTFVESDTITAQDFPLIPAFRLVLAEVFAE